MTPEQSWCGNRPAASKQAFVQLVSWVILASDLLFLGSFFIVVITVQDSKDYSEVCMAEANDICSWGPGAVGIQVVVSFLCKSL